MIRKWFLFSALIFIAGCDREMNPDQLNLSILSDIKGFDPIQSVDVRTGTTITLVYDNLVQFGDSTEILPGIAGSWEISSDGLTYTFEIHQGFKFHDGVRVSARDVVYSLNRLKDSPNSWLYSRIHQISAPEGEDGCVVKITLNEPFSPFLQFLAMPAMSILNSDLVESGDIDLFTTPAGSGPWILKEWVRDGHMLFNANREYFYGSPKIEKVKIRVISEEMTQSAEFEAGNLDIIGIPLAEFEVWINNPKWEGLIFAQNELSIYYIGLNCSRSPFDDVLVRQAMNYAVDREKILKYVLSNRGTLAHGTIPHGLPCYDPYRKAYPFNPQKAKELLSKAGYPHGFSMELWQSHASELAQVMEAFQAYWKAVGIDVKIVKNDWNIFKTAVREGKPDAYYLDWYADYPDGENFLFPLFHSSESMTKRNRYSNPEVDRLIESIQTMPDSEERIDLIKSVDQTIYEEAPWVFLWHSVSHTVVQPWIEGYSPKLMFNAQKYLELKKLAQGVQSVRGRTGSVKRRTQ